MLQDAETKVIDLELGFFESLDFAKYSRDVINMLGDLSDHQKFKIIKVVAAECLWEQTLMQKGASTDGRQQG